MPASSITRGLLPGAKLAKLAKVTKVADVREWAWWRTPVPLRCYVAAVPAAALALAWVAAAQTTWRAGDLVKFLLLLGCGMISVAATPRIAYGRGTMVQDFLTAWVLPVAVLLPPVYAMVTPAPLLLLTHWRVHRGVVYRRVFTGAAISLCYGAASLVFRAIPAGLAGAAPGTGVHALTWTVAVVAAEITGGLHKVLLSVAVKISDPSAKLAEMMLNREFLHADAATVDLGILITVVVAIHPVLAILAVPTVLLARRFMMHAQLLASSRIDSKTGLLNPGTWESEAAVEISRAGRSRSPLSVALVDIDHFKAVNDTHGHLAGDTVLKALSDVLREQLRGYDVLGRFGGEEFVVLLPQADEADALGIAERLRAHVAALPIPVKDGKVVRLTISIGVAALDAKNTQVADLLAAADAALYHAKQAGRNRTHVATANGFPLAQAVPHQAR